MIYAVVNALHILCLGVMIGAIMSLDLRVIGLWKGDGWREAIPIVSPIAATGLALALVTGVLLFSVRPGHYLGNGTFLVKLGLVVCGLANVGIFHWQIRRFAGPNPHGLLRLSAFSSVLIWTLTLFAGRFIAFIA